MPLPPKEAKKLRASLKKLKLSKEVQNILFDMKVELHEAYEEAFESQKNTIRMWERLYLDRPEDRLWHAKDRTWWKRLHGKEKILRNKAEKEYLESTFGTKVKGISEPEYSLYRADPPPEIKALARNADILIDACLRKANKRQPKEIIEAISGLSKALKPFSSMEYMHEYPGLGYRKE